MASALALLQACGAADDSGRDPTSSSSESLAQSAAKPSGDVDTSMTKTLDVSFSVPPGSEVFSCQTFKNPWAKEVDIKTYTVASTGVVLDTAAFYDVGATNGAVAPCPNGGLTTGQLTFASSAGNQTLTYPGAVGATIPKNTGFNLYVHAINTTAASETTTVALTMEVAKAGVVTTHAGVVWLENTAMEVPPASRISSSDTYTLPQAVHVVASTGEMSKFGTNLSFAAGGSTLFQTTNWDQPPTQTESPPLALPVGTPLSWTCVDSNPTSITLVFGGSSISNVRCRAITFVYPVSDVTQPVLRN
jgi:hypothetical protein